MPRARTISSFVHITLCYASRWHPLFDRIFGDWLYNIQYSILQLLKLDSLPFFQGHVALSSLLSAWYGKPVKWVSFVTVEFWFPENIHHGVGNNHDNSVNAARYIPSLFKVQFFKIIDHWQQFHPSVTDSPMNSSICHTSLSPSTAASAKALLQNDVIVSTCVFTRRRSIRTGSQWRQYCKTTIKFCL